MGWKKYFLLALIILSLTIFKSCSVNFQLKLSGSTAVAQTVNDQEAEAERLFEQGKKQFRSSQFDEALKSWKDSLTIFRQIGNRKGVANSLNNLGIDYRRLGSYPKAIDYHQQSLEIKKEIGKRQGIAQYIKKLVNANSKNSD